MRTAIQEPPFTGWCLARFLSGIGLVKTLHPVQEFKSQSLLRSGFYFLTRFTMVRRSGESYPAPLHPGNPGKLLREILYSG